MKILRIIKIHLHNYDEQFIPFKLLPIEQNASNFSRIYMTRKRAWLFQDQQVNRLYHKYIISTSSTRFSYSVETNNFMKYGPRIGRKSKVSLTKLNQFVTLWKRQINNGNKIRFQWVSSKQLMFLRKKKLNIRLCIQLL